MDKGLAFRPDSDWCSWIRRQVNRWFVKHQRPLPWRQTTDAYRIWISEIMLQQTQVATVLDYYQRFLQRFPTVQELAVAQQQDVLEIWAGLGYYQRARNLHSAARQIVERHNGHFPRNLKELQSLSGVGRYTAGAIASFAFDLPAPILETNTIRLLSRLMALTEPAQVSSSQKRLWELAESLLPKKGGSGKINQGLMELGSLVCTPTLPKCNQCPLRAGCRAHQLGLEQSIPVLKAKPATQALTHVGLLIRDDQDRVLLRCNPSGQWWEGLWDLPWIEWSQSEDMTGNRASLESARTLFADQLGLSCEIVQPLQTVRHAVTRYRIHYHCWEAELTEPLNKAVKEWRWVRKGKLPPVVSRFRRIRIE